MSQDSEDQSLAEIYIIWITGPQKSQFLFISLFFSPWTDDLSTTVHSLLSWWSNVLPTRVVGLSCDWNPRKVFTFWVYNDFKSFPSIWLPPFSLVLYSPAFVLWPTSVPRSTLVTILGPTVCFRQTNAGLGSAVWKSESRSSVAGLHCVSRDVAALCVVHGWKHRSQVRCKIWYLVLVCFCSYKNTDQKTDHQRLIIEMNFVIVKAISSSIRPWVCHTS